MGYEGKLPKTPEEMEDYVNYLRDGTFPKDIPPSRQYNWKRKLEPWRLVDNLLYLQKPGKPLRRFVPPWDEDLRRALFRQFHDDGAHRKAAVTFDKINQYHCGIAEEDVREFVRNCPSCNRVKTIKERDDLTPVVSHGPMEHLEMDLVDFTQYKSTNNEMAWLLTIVCIFSKFLWAIPLKTKEASVVGEALVSIFFQWGAPSILQSDNGKEFVATIIVKICETMGIKIRHGRPRHPMSQGQIERLNQTIGRGFTKMLWDEDSKIQHVDWTRHIGKFVFVYNTTRHSAHNHTPREVMFGYKLLGIYQYLESNITEDMVEEVEIDDSAAESEELEKTVCTYLEKVGKLRDDIDALLGKTRSTMVKRASVHRRNNPLDPGTIVAVAPDTDMNPSTRKRKLQANFKDTATVINMTNNNRTVVIQDLGGNVYRAPRNRIQPLQTTHRVALKAIENIPPSSSDVPSAISSPVPPSPQ